MRISEILKEDKITFSLEVFPPKTSERYEETAAAAKTIAKLGPDFMSVTYGAGGGTGPFTAGIAAEIQDEYRVTTLAHLTCVSSSREHVLHMLDVYREKGIENILALRGDIPKDGQISRDYKYAAELIRDIREHGDFCLGGACYPEGHVECIHKSEDIHHLQEKGDAGLDVLTDDELSFAECDLLSERKPALDHFVPNHLIQLLQLVVAIVADRVGGRRGYGEQAENEAENQQGREQFFHYKDLL